MKRKYTFKKRKKDSKEKICTNCGLLKVMSLHKSRGYYKAECDDCHNLKNKEYRRKIRIVVLKYYSNDDPKCECCGENNLEFLAIDHINGGGYKHKKETNYKDLAYWLWRHKFPEGFRVLCHNCNQSLGSYGYCPHKKDQGS